MVVCQLQTQLLVYRTLVTNVSGSQQVRQSTEMFDHFLDFVRVHSAVGFTLSGGGRDLRFRSLPLLLNFVNPLGNKDRIRARLQRGAMSSQFPVVFGERAPWLDKWCRPIGLF
ncbi:MAG: hypothetical protein J2P18_18810 [Nocardia sp.]|nr:hypothetical protein [Nocardia sp.]